MATRAATPWGPADLVEELTVPQQAGTKRFSSRVQLLETAKGERLVRFSYAGAGGGGRGPVTLREKDIRPPRGARDLDRHEQRALTGRVDQRREQERSVVGAEQRVHRVLGVRHQPHHVA